MNITVIGAGKVGSALSQALRYSGNNIQKIISRSEDNAARLAKATAAKWSTEKSVPDDTDVVIISVNDDAISEVIKDLNDTNAVVVHTAGSVGLEVFDGRFRHCGVFYPLQTFSQNRQYDLNSVPVFIESSNDSAGLKLKALASTLTDQVFTIDSEKRKFLHASAVFSCNFVNHMYSAGDILAKEAGVDFSVLIPLVRETLEKAIDIGPDSAQTGPALRNDKKTIEKHMELLSFLPDLQNIYRTVTDSIINKYAG